MISGIKHFREIILQSSRTVSETPPGSMRRQGVSNIVIGYAG